MKFLIVDDSPAMQAIVRRSLQRAGYGDLEFRLAGNGREAIDIIRIWEPEVVITDWHMPEMSGLDLIRECQRQMLGIKIGLVTTETSPERIQEARNAGALFVLHKPFEQEEFSQVLLPIIQGAVEGEALLANAASEPDPTTYELRLPSLGAMNKVIDGVTLADVQLIPADRRKVDYRYLPYVVALFSDHEKSTIKAVCIMDIRAAAVLSCAVTGEFPEIYNECLQNKSMGKKLLDNIKRMMKLVGALFYDPSNQQDLDLKSVHLIPKPFDRLEKLGSSVSDKRMDITVTSPMYGEGHLILMEVLE
ncbi:MAG: response regulator [Saccharospirillaceae bacterium]|nr:response regulator [Saccharospirillaceae bacterium]MCD8531587.1 response regulator [Saccharospirillaceae bacterium]